jgi:uncharacterized 2Fe-2S/4Fe-4S cluster protein (DUF4445 family)
MPRVTFLPSGQSVDIDSDTTLRDAAHCLGINVYDRCGGMGACCNCVVTITAGHDHLNAKTLVEDAVFYLAPNDRLSCQTKITGDVTLSV